jgi:bacillithiol system protein YtxJ
MGLFNSIFGSGNSGSESRLNWNHLSDVSQLDTIKTNSETKPQLIFKHSTRCGISRMVLNQFEKSFNFNDQAFDLYYLDLLQYRPISNEVSERFGVYHQSPQLLIVKNGVVVVHESHGSINDLDLNQYL